MFTGKEVDWDDKGRLIIKDKGLATAMKNFVLTASDANPKNLSRGFQLTRLFQVVEGPHEQEPMDLLCRIIVEFPVPPKP